MWIQDERVKKQDLKKHLKAAPEATPTSRFDWSISLHPQWQCEGAYYPYYTDVFNTVRRLLCVLVSRLVRCSTSLQHVPLGFDGKRHVTLQNRCPTQNLFEGNSEEPECNFDSSLFRGRAGAVGAGGRAGDDPRRWDLERGENNYLQPGTAYQCGRHSWRWAEDFSDSYTLHEILHWHMLSNCHKKKNQEVKLCLLAFHKRKVTLCVE